MTHQAYLKALNAGVITQGNFLLTLPTGAGKTHLAQQAAEHELQRGKVLVLMPTKALVQQTTQEWQKKLPHHHVEAYTSDRKNVPPYRSSDVIITTPERLDLLTRNWRKHKYWLGQIALTILDEAHMLGDQERGASIDAALTRLRLINPLSRLIAMTATCGNPKELAAWLEATHVHSDIRPVPLIWNTIHAKSPTERQAALIQTLDQRYTLVFVHSRKRAEELTQTLQGSGIKAAAHHAGLSSEERQNIEKQLGLQQITCVIATPTLEVGVNFPVERVILYDIHYHNGKKRTPLSINSAWQRAGRAGRWEMDHAEVTVIGHPNDEPEHYQYGEFEALQSPLLQTIHAESFILGSIDAGMVITVPQAERLIRHTFAAQQQQYVPDTCKELIRQEAIIQHAERLEITQLGRVASQFMLPVATVAYQKFLPETPTAFDLILHASKHIPTLRPSEAGGGVSLLQNATIPSHELDHNEYFSDDVLYTAHIIWAACYSSDADCAASYQIYETQIRQVREDAARIIESWHAYLNTPKTRLVSVMVKAGLPLHVATLTLLEGVGKQTARKIAKAGFEDLEALALAEVHELLGTFHAKKATHLIQQAENKVKEYSQELVQEPPASANRPMRFKHPKADPIRLERAMHLQVIPEGKDFIVTGGEQSHRVSKNGRCDCLDHTHTHLCKHVLATLLYQQDPAITAQCEWLISD